MDFKFEEFEESDVIFSDDYSSDQSNNQSICGNFRRSQMKMLLMKKNKHQQSCSAPVDIPGSNNSSPSSSFRYDDISDFDDFTCFDEIHDLGLVPPHLIVERRSVDGQLACSFNQRKLNVKKGRNLIQVRNSILKLTGFLES